MLDEIKEYEEYTETEKNRILGRAERSPFLGLYRVFTIMARHQFYHNESIYTEISDEERKMQRNKVYEMFTRWCGLDSDGSPEESELARLFRRDGKDTYLKFIDNKEKKSGWAVNNFYNVLEFKHPNINAFNFHIVIADAIQQGPLKQRKMICKKNFFENLEVDIDKENRFLKVIAACLLNENHAYEDMEADEKYLYKCFYLDKQAVANWIGYASFATPKKHEYYFEDYVHLEEKYPVIKVENGIVKLLKAYIEDYDFRIVPMDYRMSKEEEAEYLLIEDMGALTTLKYDISKSDRANAYIKTRRLLNEYAIVTIEKGGPKKDRNNKYPFYLVKGIEPKGFERILYVRGLYDKNESLADVYRDILEKLKARGVASVHFFADYEDEFEDDLEALTAYREAKKVIKDLFPGTILLKKNSEVVQSIGCGSLFRYGRLSKNTNEIYQKLNLKNQEGSGKVIDLDERLIDVTFETISEATQIQKIKKWNVIWNSLKKETWEK